MYIKYAYILAVHHKQHGYRDPNNADCAIVYSYAYTRRRPTPYGTVGWMHPVHSAIWRTAHLPSIITKVTFADNGQTYLN